MLIKLEHFIDESYINALHILHSHYIKISLQLTKIKQIHTKSIINNIQSHNALYKYYKSQNRVSPV